MNTAPLSAANHTPGCAQLQGVIVFPLLHYSANPCESLKAKSPRELTPRGQQELVMAWASGAASPGVGHGAQANRPVLLGKHFIPAK